MVAQAMHWLARWVPEAAIAVGSKPCMGWLVGTYDAGHGRCACRIHVTFSSRRGSPVGMPQDHLAFMWDNHMKAMP
jgi:hypothetical protein